MKFEAIEKILSDGSKVYDVVVAAPEYGDFEVNAESLNSALAMQDALNALAFYFETASPASIAALCQSVQALCRGMPR